ncbi:hypothetical protein [Streptomyces sp. NBC_00063]|uniref:MmyB family transcriptional regulator n=1 Tax=Streptomyces sp. NBC_00063 TaxID=2975638 RepID=UPI003D7344AB
MRDSLQQILDAMTGAAAFVRNAHLDVLATNQLTRTLYQEALDTDDQPPNLARFVFLDPRARHFYRDWDGIAHDAVGSLRTEAARTPGNTDLADLINELATHSDEFAMRWDAHDVEYYRSGQQRFHHPAVGDIDLDYDALEIPADPGLTLVTYTLTPTSAYADVFRRLQAHAVAGGGCPSTSLAVQEVEAEGELGHERGGNDGQREETALPRPWAPADAVALRTEPALLPLGQATATGMGAAPARPGPVHEGGCDPSPATAHLITREVTRKAPMGSENASAAVTPASARQTIPTINVRPVSRRWSLPTSSVRARAARRPTQQRSAHQTKEEPFPRGRRPERAGASSWSHSPNAQIPLRSPLGNSGDHARTAGDRETRPRAPAR